MPFIVALHIACPFIAPGLAVSFLEHMEYIESVDVSNRQARMFL